MVDTAKEPSTPYGEGGSEPKATPSPNKDGHSTSNSGADKGKSGGLPEGVTEDPSQQPT